MIGFPLLVIPFAIYNMIAFLTPIDWGTPLSYAVPLKSGLTWTPTAERRVHRIFSLLMLMFEFIKSTKSRQVARRAFLALLLAGGAAAEFVMVDPAKIMKAGTIAPIVNSTFLMLRRDLLRRSVRGLCGGAAPRAAHGRRRV